MRGLAYPMMPALGAMFAVLTAITLSSEAGYLKSAQDGVSQEAAAASKLAWAATNPNVDAAPIHASLERYLVATRTNEWSGDAAATGDDPADGRRPRRPRAHRADGRRRRRPSGRRRAASCWRRSTRSRPGAGAGWPTPSRDLPALYIVTLIASGLALVANAGAIVSAVSRRAALLVASLTVVVALSLALLCALTGPFRGALAVSGEPIDAVIEDLRSGFFTRS